MAMRRKSSRGFGLFDARQMLNRLSWLILALLLAASSTPGVALQSASSQAEVT